jgi:hypothetical protein
VDPDLFGEDRRRESRGEREQRGEPVFRPPWYGEDERADFLREQHESGLGESAIERGLSLIRHGSGAAAPW